MRLLAALLVAVVLRAVDVPLQVYGVCDPTIMTPVEQSAASTAQAQVFRSLHYGTVVVTATDPAAFSAYPIYRAQIVPQLTGAVITGYRVAALFADAQNATGNIISSPIITYDPGSRPLLAAPGAQRLRPYVLSGSTVRWYQLAEGATFASDLDGQSFRWATRRYTGYAVDDGSWIHAGNAAIAPSSAITSTQPISSYAGAWVQLRNATTGTYIYLQQRSIQHDATSLFDPVRYDGELLSGGAYQSTADPMAWRASYRLDTNDCSGSFASALATTAASLPSPLNAEAAGSELPPPTTVVDPPAIDMATQRGPMAVQTIGGTQTGDVVFYSSSSTKANSTVDLHADVASVQSDSTNAGGAEPGLMAAISVAKPNPASGSIAGGSVTLTYAPDPLTGIAATDAVSGQSMSINADADANKLVMVRYDDQGNAIDPQDQPVVVQPKASSLGNDILSAVDTANAIIAPHLPGGATWTKPARNVHHGSSLYPIDLYDTSVMTGLGMTRRVPMRQRIGASLTKGYVIGPMEAGESLDIRYDEGAWNIVPDTGSGVVMRSSDGDGVPLAICAAGATTPPVPADMLAQYPWLPQVTNVLAWVPRSTRTHAWTFTTPTAQSEVWLACPDAGNRNDNVGSVTYWVTYRATATNPPRNWTDRSGSPSPGDGDNPQDPRPRGSDAFCGQPFYDFDDDGDLDRWYTDDPFDGGYKRLRVQWRVEDGNKELGDFSYRHGNHVMVSGITKPKRDPASGLWVVREDLLLHFNHNHKPFHHKKFSITKGYKTYYSGSHATMLDPIDPTDRTLYQFALKNFGVTEAADSGADGVSPEDMIPVIETTYEKQPKDLNGDGLIKPDEYEAKRTTVTWYVKLGSFYDATDPGVTWAWRPAFTLPTAIADRPLIPAIVTQTMEKPDGTVISTFQSARPFETDPTSGAIVEFNPALVPIIPPPPPGSVTARSDGYQYDYPANAPTAQGGNVPANPQAWQLPWNIIRSSKSEHCTKTFSLNSANLGYFDAVWSTKTPVISHQGLLNDLTMSGGTPRVQWIVRENTNNDPVSQSESEWKKGQVLYTEPGWLPGTEWLMPGRSMLHVFNWDGRTDMCYPSRHVGDIFVKSGERFYEIISGLGEYYFRGKKFRPVTVDEQQKLLIRMWNYYFTGYEQPAPTADGGLAILPSLAIPQRYDNENATSRPLNQAAIAIDETAIVTTNGDKNRAGGLAGRLFRDMENPNGDPDSQHRAAVERRSKLMREQIYVFSAARGREWEVEYAKRMPNSVRLVCVEWENQAEVKAAFHDRDVRFPEIRSSVTTDSAGITTTTTTSAETELMKEISKTWFDGGLTRMGYKNGGFGKTLSGGGYTTTSAEEVGADVANSHNGFPKTLPEGLPATRAAFAYELRSAPAYAERQWTIDPGQQAIANYTVEFRHPMLMVYHDRASMLYVHYGRNTNPDEVFGAWDLCAPLLSPIDAQSPEFRRRKRFEDWATNDNLSRIYQSLHPSGFSDWLATRGDGPPPPPNPGGEPQPPTEPLAPTMAEPVPPVAMPAPTSIRNWDAYAPTYPVTYREAGNWPSGATRYSWTGATSSRFTFISTDDRTPNYNVYIYPPTGPVIVYTVTGRPEVKNRTWTFGPGTVVVTLPSYGGHGRYYHYISYSYDTYVPPPSTYRSLSEAEFPTLSVMDGYSIAWSPWAGGIAGYTVEALQAMTPAEQYALYKAATPGYVNVDQQISWYTSVYNERLVTVNQVRAYLEYQAKLTEYHMQLATWAQLWQNYETSYAAYLSDQTAWQASHAEWALKKQAWDAWVDENQVWLDAKHRGDSWQQDRDAWIALIMAEITPPGVSWSGDPSVSKSTLVDIRAIVPQIPIWEGYGWFIDPVNGVPAGAL